jgi:hypothetical protein
MVDTSLMLYSPGVIGSGEPATLPAMESPRRAPSARSHWPFPSGLQDARMPCPSLS